MENDQYLENEKLKKQKEILTRVSEILWIEKHLKLTMDLKHIVKYLEKDQIINKIKKIIEGEFNTEKS